MSLLLGKIVSVKGLALAICITVLTVGIRPRPSSTGGSPRNRNASPVWLNPPQGLMVDGSVEIDSSLEISSPLFCCQLNVSGQAQVEVEGQCEGKG